MGMTDAAFAQAGFRIRLEWGPIGARAIGAGAAHVLTVVVDVLSFTTSVSVACDRGIEVFPFRWNDERAEAFAAEQQAVLARGGSARQVSLSPSSLRRSDGPRRVVLPSPNGATLAVDVAERGGRVVAGCLRNAAAVARYASEFLDADASHVVAVIAAGERWPDGSLRPAVEDLLGAAAVIGGIGRYAEFGSTETLVAAQDFRGAADVPDLLRGCASGRELIEKGFAEDVTIAAELNASRLVPELTGPRFVAARR